MSQHIYVLRYDHRHGTDISAYASEGLARKARADIALAWAHELPNEDDAIRIRELYADGEYDEAVALYIESHVDESLDIDDLEILGADAGVRVLDAASKLVHHARLLPTSRDPGITACKRMFWWTSTDVTFVENTQNMKVVLPPEQPPLSCLECVTHDEE
jgi:hypothetical protein